MVATCSHAPSYDVEQLIGRPRNSWFNEPTASYDTDRDANKAYLHKCGFFGARRGEASPHRLRPMPMDANWTGRSFESDDASRRERADRVARRTTPLSANHHRRLRSPRLRAYPSAELRRPHPEPPRIDELPPAACRQTMLADGVRLYAGRATS